MNDQPDTIDAEVLTVETRAGALVTEVTSAENAVATFTDPNKFKAFVDQLKAVVADFEPDLTTKKGREAIASLSYKITRSKTALDKAGKGLTEEWRAKTAAVNASRKVIEETLESMARSVRKPLDDWEAIEKERVAKQEAEINRICRAAVVGQDETADQLEERGRKLHDEVLDAEVLGDRLEEAEELRTDACRQLAQAMHLARKREDEAAELATLRREKEERDRLDAEADRLAQEEAAERERVEQARIAEERRQREEAERLEQEAERQRLAEEERVAREAKIAEEAAAKVIRDREAAEAAAAAEEERKRQDAEHRETVIDEVAKSILTAGVFTADVPSGTAERLATAMVDGQIERVTVRL